MKSPQELQIKAELKAAGAGSIAMLTPEVHELVRLLHPDEHIGGVIYGSYPAGLAWLVATDKRVIFIDRKPFFSTIDELTYDIVTGTSMNRAGIAYSVILHTRVTDYTMRFVPGRCANIFVDYIDSRRLESGDTHDVDFDTGMIHHALPLEPASALGELSTEAMNFLKEHDLGVFSTVDRTGNVHGAVVYYMVDRSHFVYILTKSETEKGRDIYAHNQVALTVHEPGTQMTVQMQGMAYIETDQALKDMVLMNIIKLRSYREGKQLPPVTKLHEGSFIIIRIRPTVLEFHDYSKLI
jgi:general stress protein 26